MPLPYRNTLTKATFLVAASIPGAGSAAGTELIDNWTDTVVSASRVLIFFGGFLGILYAGWSMKQAYTAQDEEARLRHMMAAGFSGVFTIIGVIVGWVSGLLFPS